MQLQPEIIAVGTGPETLDYVTSCALPTPWAQFTLHAFVESPPARNIWR